MASEKLNRTHGRIDIMSEGILRQKVFSLLFETSEENSSLPISSIDMINNYSSVILDSGFLNKALQAGILINIFDNYGKLVGRFSPNSSLKAPVVTHNSFRLIMMRNTGSCLHANSYWVQYTIFGS